VPLHFFTERKMKSTMRTESHQHSADRRKTSRAKVRAKDERDELTPEMTAYLQRMDAKLESPEERARLLQKKR
jgi:hypothetical protein